MATRSTAVTAAAAAAAALVATGITYASAASEPAQAAPVARQVAAAPLNGSSSNDNGKGNEGEDHGDHGDNNDNDHYGFHDYGRIHVNERDYSAAPGGCITVVSGLGSNTLNVRNDSRRTVEVFQGATCDNGAPIATVGPWSSSNGLRPRNIRDGVRVRNGVVGSLRVVRDFYFHHEENEHEHGGGGYSGGK
ncbi:hypothetical protein ABZ845_14910 [Streptomyces sp. NPDC047022]|uniref:hypothetical protein n=1 Tax=Streptomyces sp. NPDC047022 TaxID=3155737 RepID=UPI0033EF7AD1